MTRNHWLIQLSQRWLQRGRSRRHSLRRASAKIRRRTTLSLEALEDRLALAVFNVTTTADTDAANLTTGVDANGQVSLRSALEAANDLGGNNTINLPANTYKLTLGGNLNIDNDLTIAGAGSGTTTIDAQKLDRIFTVSSSQVVVLSGVGLTDGQTSSQGGALYNSGNLTLLNDDVYINQVLALAGDDAEGGSIFNTANGILNVINTVISNSTAQAGNGSAGTNGSVSTLFNGTAGGKGGQAFGGAIYNDGGEVNISGGDLYGSAMGGNGGQGGSGVAYSVADHGDNGGNGGAGGQAAGGGIYSTSGGIVVISGGSGARISGFAEGGIGGQGGNGGDGGGGHVAAGGSNGPAGNGGVGGNGGAGGTARGGGIFSSNGTIIIDGGNFFVQANGSSVGGKGGDGGYGGFGGANVSGVGGNGGAGGPGGVGGDGLGGAIYNTTGLVSITGYSGSGIAEGGTGGTGNAGGGGGSASRAREGAGGSGADGGAAGLCAGGDIYNAAGSVIITASEITEALAAGNGFNYGGDGGNSGNGGWGFPANAGTGASGSNAFGAAIYSAGGTVEIEQCHLGENIATSGPGGDGGNGGETTSGGGAMGGQGGTGGQAQGGAIAIFGGAVTITNSTFDGNQAQGGKGGGGGSGGGATTAFFAGKSGTGGAGGNGLGGDVFLSGGSLSVTNCTFAYPSNWYINNGPYPGAVGGNGGSGGGGGRTDGDGGTGGSGLGGAIYVASGTLDLSSSTISGLQAQQGAGGSPGLYGGASGNAGAYGSGMGGGIYAASGGAAQVFNSLIAANAANNVADTDVTGTFISQGHNLIGNADGATGFGATGDLLGTSANPINPMLGTLEGNGGEVNRSVTALTLALQSGSPAINAPNLPGTPTVPATDERGVPRDSQPDIGAYEYSSTNNSSIGADVPSLLVPGLQTAYANVATAINLGSFGDDNTESPWSASVNWGDKSTPTTFSVSTENLGTQSHTYAAPGVYTVTETVTNQRGAVGTGYFVVAVGSLSVTPADTSTVAGTSTDLTVTVLDPFNRPVTNFTGTMQFKSTDPNTMFSDAATGNPLANDDYSFTDADQGTHVFTVSLQKAATQYIAVADTTPGSPGGAASITVTPAAPASITATAGDNQVADPDSAFGTTLQATVTDAYGNDVPGVSVTFTAPSSGASGTFAGGATSVTETTDAQGVATAPAFTANDAAGSDTVTASVSGVSTPASFNLVNDEPISLSAASVPASTQGVAYNQTLTASGGTGSLTMGYTVTSGSIPAGLTFTTDTNSLGIAGTPTASGTVSFNVTITDTIGGSITQGYTLTINPPVSLSASSVPASTQGVGYNQILTASDGTGDKAMTYNITSGAIPDGLTFTTSTNQLVITGTPTANGTVSFDLTATDAVGGSVTQSYTLTINPPVTLSAASAPPSTQGVLYNQTLGATGGTGDKTMSYTITSGAVPTGLSFSDNINGLVISGTPKTSGTVSFNLTATDAVGASATRGYTLVINPPVALSATSVPASTQGAAYNQTLTAGDGTGDKTMTYRVTSGGLPSGLTFTASANQLAITGTPTASGTVSFDVTATDSVGASATQSYTLTINPPISLSASSVPASTQGVAYNQTLAASGGTGSVNVTYIVTSGTLPAGLAFSTGAGLLTVVGTPTASGTVSFEVTATDSVGATATKSYTLTINPPVSLSTTSVPAGTVGVAYDQTVTASGGTGSIVVVYTIASGAIPAGLNFTVTTNHLTIAGTPRAGGTVSFLVTATDSVGGEATHESTLTVSAPPPSPPPPSPPAPPTLITPPLLAFFDSLLGGVETVNGNGTETITDSFFGIPLLVSTFDSSGKLESIALFGINVTALFEML